MEILFNYCYTPVMAIEILGAALIFLLRQDRKEHFYARLTGSALVCITATIWIEIIYTLVSGKAFLYSATNEIADSVFKFIYYLVIFLMVILCMRVSFDLSQWMIILYCSAGYTVQHMANNVVSLLCELPFFDHVKTEPLSYIFLRVIIFNLIYLCVRRFFLRNGKEIYGSEENIQRKVSLAFLVVFICIGLSRITTDDISRGPMAVLAETVYAIICCVLLLSIVYDLHEKDKMLYEIDMMQELLHRDKAHYLLAKENIDIINMKCHDLKHQIQELRRSNGLQEKYTDEIEDAIMIYDSVMSVKTGNDVLDVIITEKLLLCEKNCITLNCMVNGEKLNFMDRMDIYSLFGNALSNAIEEVNRIKEEDRRCISINVHTHGSVLSIHVENFYAKKPAFSNGLPISTKDETYHGFGMKSMEYIAKKYDGVMSAVAKDGKFYLDFVIPIRNTTPA